MNGVGFSAKVRLVIGLGTVIVAASKLAVTDPPSGGHAMLPSALQ
jgi:hypothetical protein